MKYRSKAAIPNDQVRGKKLQDLTRELKSLGPGRPSGIAVNVCNRTR